LSVGIDVDSVELGKVLANALAFCPARSKFPAVQLRSSAFALTALSSDTYTIGQSWMPLEDGALAEATLPLKDAQALEALARMDRSGTAATGQHGVGRLEFTPGDCLVFTPELKGEPLVLQDIGQTETAHGHYSELWARCSELLQRLEGSNVSGPPLRLLLDPVLLARFAKVKGVSETGDDVVMDMLFQEGDNGPVLVKIGERFTGALMPVNREQNAKMQGTGGQWPQDA
jgi:hypothetical protein